MVANQPLTRPYSGGGGWEGGMKKLSLVEGKIITEKKLPCQWPCGGCMFHRHLTSILALNLWTLYVTRTRSKAISVKIKNSPENLSRNEKNRIERNSTDGRHRLRCFSPSMELHHLSPIPKCFVFFGGLTCFLLEFYWYVGDVLTDFLPRLHGKTGWRSCWNSMIPLPGSLQVC